MIRLKCFGPRPNLSSQSPRGVLSRLDGAARAPQSSNTAGGRRSGCARSTAALTRLLGGDFAETLALLASGFPL